MLFFSLGMGKYVGRARSPYDVATADLKVKANSARKRCSL
jgi:hypothetical protein